MDCCNKTDLPDLKSILKYAEENFFKVTIIILIIILIIYLLFNFGYKFGKNNCDTFYNKIGKYSLLEDVKIDNINKIITCGDNKCNLKTKDEYSFIGSYKFLNKDIIIDGSKIIPNPDVYINPIYSNKDLILLNYEETLYLNCCDNKDDNIKFKIYDINVTNGDIIQFINPLYQTQQPITGNSILFIKYFCAEDSYFLQKQNLTDFIGPGPIIREFKIIKINTDNINKKQKLTNEDLNNVDIITIDEPFILIYSEDQTSSLYVYRDKNGYLKLTDTFSYNTNFIFKCKNYKPNFIIN
jgi:hypothetical protein